MKRSKDLSICRKYYELAVNYRPVCNLTRKHYKESSSCGELSQATGQIFRKYELSLCSLCQEYKISKMIDKNWQQWYEICIRNTVEERVLKYQAPEYCEYPTDTTVNEEIWHVLSWVKKIVWIIFLANSRKSSHSVVSTTWRDASYPTYFLIS